MEEALIALLLKSAALKALVGTDVYWGRAPQTMTGKTYVTMQVISGPRTATMQHAGGYTAKRVQADAYGPSYTIAKKVARALRVAAAGRRGSIIQGIFVDGERDLPAADAGEVNHLFRTSLDLIVHHTE